MAAPMLLYHTTHLGWGYKYLVSGEFEMEDRTQNPDGRACGPVLVDDATENTNVNCDRGYRFGSGMTSFFDMYGRDLTLIQDVHDPNDWSWTGEEFVYLTPA